MAATRQLALVLLIAACGAGTTEAPRRPQAPRAAPAPAPTPAPPAPVTAIPPADRAPAARPVEPAPPPGRERRPRPAERPEPVEAPPREAKLAESVVDRVFFARNEASLGESLDALDAFARLALESDEVTLVLIARADVSELDPDSLSSRRALAVRSYLVRSGVPEERIRTHALGVRQPRTGDSTANRCVELATE